MKTGPKSLQPRSYIVFFLLLQNKTRKKSSIIVQNILNKIRLERIRLFIVQYYRNEIRSKFIEQSLGPANDSKTGFVLRKDKEKMFNVHIILVLAFFVYSTHKELHITF